MQLLRHLHSKSGGGLHLIDVLGALARDIEAAKEKSNEVRVEFAFGVEGSVEFGGVRGDMGWVGE